MKRGPATFLTLTLLCSSIQAQQHARPAGGDFAERFKQLDRNGDGKLYGDEFDRPRIFRQMDRDGDGFVTL